MHLRRWALPVLAAFALVSSVALARPGASAPSAAAAHDAHAQPAPAAALALPAAQDPAKPVKAVRFTGIPTANTADLEAKYKPLAKYLTDKLGVPFEYVPSADYNASVDGFVNGDLQLAWFGGLTGLRARQRVEGAQVIVCGKIDREFKTYFVANKASGLAKSDEFPMALKGKKFTFGSDSSTSGRLMPEFFIRKHTKLSPKEFFGVENNFSGGHDKTAKLVEAGTFDAGAMDFKQYEKMVAEFKKEPKSEKGIDPDKVQVIWVTPTYVDYHFTAHPKLDAAFGAGFTKKLQQALIELKDEALLKALDRPEGLVEATNADFDVLKGVAKEIGLVR
ncbi:MAG: putative selenate ABC transporter substrate-binding protein [Planctomycetes bacterium]|nr:putative selenate ABC transporter substrate-binding protein [Planctomycetota bacterium]